LQRALNSHRQVSVVKFEVDRLKKSRKRSYDLFCIYHLQLYQLVLYMNGLWRELSGCRQAKSARTWPFTNSLHFEREDWRILAGLLTGHTDLNRYLCI